MNKLKVLYANNSLNLFKFTLKEIGAFVSDLSKENIIVVPDKLSLATEQEIFNALNIDVYYNISVMGISKFANKIIAENNLEFMQCSGLQSKLLTLVAIQNVSDKFKCFSKKFTMGFVDEIYAKIEQIKSSNINIDELYDENAGIGTKLKFDDIKLIYNEYEKLRDGKLDSGALLGVFNNICEQSEYLKNCNVFFVGFDSLTKQGLELLKNVAKTANFAQISVVYGKNAKNVRLYDQTFFESIINVCKQDKIECEAVWCELKFDDDRKNYILNNLFSRTKNIEKNNNFFEIYKTNSFAEEVELCIKQINYLLKTTDTKFGDIAICADESYANFLITELRTLNIGAYSDQKINIIELEPIKYLLAIINFAYSKNSQYLYEILCNDFCGICKEEAEQFLTALTKYGSVNNVKNFSESMFEKVFNLIDNIFAVKISAEDIAENYIEKINAYIKNLQIYEKIAQKCDFFEQKQEILLNKTYLQIEKKLQDCLTSIQNILQKTILSFNDFKQILEKCLTETQINSVPSAVNEVFVGDLKSFYLNKKYIFVLGMNEGLMPTVLADTGLISDKEITSESLLAKLEPTTRIINKRNRFKLFEILLSAKDKCYLTYHAYDQENKPSQPNEFISEVLYLFNNKVISAQELKFLLNDDKLEKICFNLIDNYNANLVLKEDIDPKIKNLVNGALLKNNMLFKKVDNKFIFKQYSKLFFKENRASVSVVEKYNRCPKSAFLANGLKLQKVKKDKIEADLIGSFLHAVGEVFVKNNLKELGKLTQNEIISHVEIIFDNLLKDESFYALCLPANKFTLKLLKDESLRFCNFINYEQTLSNFKPIYAEKYFGGKSGFLPINIDVDGEEYNISGFVDRIDVCENAFRIIDYKTGNTTNSKGAEQLFYGTKIQLFVYAKAIKNNLNKHLFGVFYLPIKNGFSKAGKAQYAFSGFFENDARMAINCDSSLFAENGKSELLNVAMAKVKADGELKLKKKANLLSDDELLAYLNYAVEVVRQTVKDVNSGFIECSPIKDGCRVCEFNQICIHAFDEKCERSENYDVTSEDFAKVLEKMQNGN